MHEKNKIMKIKNFIQSHPTALNNDDDTVTNTEWTCGSVNSYVRPSKFQTYFI